MKGVICALLAATLATGPACVGSTGGEVVDFPAAASGPKDARAGQPLVFTNDRGWNVALSKAVIHVGATYLDQNLPVSGAQNTSCILPGLYIAQVTEGLDVDLLSPAPQRFPRAGHGTTGVALAGQVWLTGGAVDALTDETTILTIEGTASFGADVRPFAGAVTISANRKAESELAGANPICKERIVSPIPTRVVVERGGGLLLRIDPRLLFVNVDFAQLVKGTESYGFSDEPSDIDPASPSFYSQPSVNLYQNLHSGGALFTFTWEPSL